MSSRRGGKRGLVDHVLSFWGSRKTAGNHINEDVFHAEIILFGERGSALTQFHKYSNLCIQCELTLLANQGAKKGFWYFVAVLDWSQWLIFR